MAKLSDKLQALRVGPELRLPRFSRSPEGGEEAASAAADGVAAPERAPRRTSLHNFGPELKLPSISRHRTSDGLVGLEIEADSVAVAEVRSGGTELSASVVAPLPQGAFSDGEVVDPAAIAAVLREVFAEHKLSKRVRLGVANQRVVTRTIRMPAIEDPAQLAAAVRFQAEEQIPMPIDQAVLDHRVVGGTPASEEEGATIDVVVSAARREMISRILMPLREAGLQPVGIDLSAFGMIRALAGPPGAAEVSPATVLYCNVGDNTNLAIARGRACLFTRVSPAGLESIAEGLAATTGLSLEHARQWLGHVGLSDPIEGIEGDAGAVAASRAALLGGASALVDELRLSMDFYAAQEGTEPIERVVLGGPGAALRGMVEQLGVSLGLPVEAGVPQVLAAMDPVSAARLTLPYGLALEE